MEHKILLDEKDIPKQWYNLAPDLPTPMLPPLGPDGKPVSPDMLTPVFPMNLIEQEVSQERWIKIPEEILEILYRWRPSPLRRAVYLEKHLKTPAKIYYKDESVSPPGSHKPNTAVPQAWYNKQFGIKKITTETGAGQWGSALAFACKLIGLECKVFMVRISFDQKPFRKTMMQVWGANCVASPSKETNAGGHVEGQRWDYALYYAGALNPEQNCETLYRVGYRYFNYPELSSHRAFNPVTGDIGSVDLQEMFAGVAFPKLLGIPGLVPGYVLLKTWPSNSDTVVGAANPNGGSYAGWAHVFMLDYGVPLTCICPEATSQILNLHAETVYNDGVDPRPFGGYTESDFTHVLFGASTDFDLGRGMSLTPALYYQITFEDNGAKGPVVFVPGTYQGINPNHDMVWASLTFKYKF